jgi:hypothetical protein
MYGFSMVMFRDGKVDNWTSTDVKLKARYLTATNLVPKEYFTVGSTRDEVLAIHGEPTRFGDNYLMYGFSMVMFREGKVDNWTSADVKLKAKYITTTNLAPKEYFTVGSTREEVLAIQGEPTRFSDNYLMYGLSMVMFRDGKVDNWTTGDVELKAKHIIATNLPPQEYFTVGSTRDEVLAIQGEPTRFTDSYLMYGASMVMLRDGKVDYWNNADIRLKGKYTTPENPLQKQYPTESNAPTPQPLPLAEPSPVLPRTSKQPDRDAENATLKPTPMPVITVQAPEQPQVNGIAYMDNFLGEKNFCIPSDNIINMKTDALKFQINGTTYNYSGHYAVMLITPRKHRAPLLGFGTPEKAKLIIINNFGGDAIPLPDATVWEKSNGFIDMEALGKEWICSGPYTIQN